MFLAFLQAVVFCSCFEFSPAFLQDIDCCALLYRIYKHGLFSVLCCYPSCSRCLKVASGRLQTICKNFDVANCLEENVTNWVCGRGFGRKDWSCFHIQQGKHRLCAISFANLLQTRKLTHAFVLFSVLTQDCCKWCWWFHRGRFLLAGTSFLFVMPC